MQSTHIHLISSVLLSSGEICNYYSRVPPWTSSQQRNIIPLLKKFIHEKVNGTLHRLCSWCRPRWKVQWGLQVSTVCLLQQRNDIMNMTVENSCQRQGWSELSWMWMMNLRWQHCTCPFFSIPTHFCTFSLTLCLTSSIKVICLHLESQEVNISFSYWDTILIGNEGVMLWGFQSVTYSTVLMGTIMACSWCPRMLAATALSVFLHQTFTTMK